MKLTNRQKQIIKILQEADSPISGELLGDAFGVSRQVIVKDMSLLKAFGVDIISTNKGYKMPDDRLFTKIIEARHTDSDISDELNTIVDKGGVIVDVFINHPVYGVIRKDLDIHSRNGVRNFVKNMDESIPLKNLTDNVHYHTIRAESRTCLKDIEKALRDKGYTN